MRKVLEVQDENAVARLDELESDTETLPSSTSDDIPPGTPTVPQGVIIFYVS